MIREGEIRPLLEGPVRHRRGLRRIRLSFTGDHLTRFGGAFLLHRFLQRLRLRERFRREVPFAQRNNTYTIPEMLLALLYPIILGLERIETTELLQRNLRLQGGPCDRVPERAAIEYALNRIDRLRI